MSGATDLGPNWGRLASNGTNLGFVEPKCTENDLKKSQIYPIWRQFDPTRQPCLRLEQLALLSAHIGNFVTD